MARLPLGKSTLVLCSIFTDIFLAFPTGSIISGSRSQVRTVSDIAEANTLLHGQESLAFGDAGYQGVEKRPDSKADVAWHVAMRPGKRRALDKDNEVDALLDQIEKLKAGVRAKVEHPFRVIKRQFGFVKVRYRGLKKNTAQLFTLFALSNLWMVRGKLMGAGA